MIHYRKSRPSKPQKSFSLEFLLTEKCEEGGRGDGPSGGGRDQCGAQGRREWESWDERRRLTATEWGGDDSFSKMQSYRC